jgi:hypothetical protein
MKQVFTLKVMKQVFTLKVIMIFGVFHNSVQRTVKVLKKLTSIFQKVVVPKHPGQLYFVHVLLAHSQDQS